jgi:alcohol dehydrogenase class IV
MNEIKDLLEAFIPAITRSGIAAPKCACEVPDAFLELVKTVGAPATIAELGYTEGDIPAFAHSLFADYYRAKNPRTADEASLAELVKMMYNGKIEY